MAKRSKPRAGSLAYKPRKRAKKETPRIRHWPSYNEEVKPLGFAGYKAGMTHLIVRDNRKGSRTSGLETFMAVTVLETPPLFVSGIRFYKNGYNGKETFTDVFIEIDKKEKSKGKQRKKKGKEGDKSLKKVEEKIKNIEKNLNEIKDVTLIVNTQPKLTGIGKKKPDIMEIPIGGNNIEEKFNYAKEKLGKEISISEVFNEKTFLDVHAVTKGKGFQGVIKRHGTILQPRKYGKGRRHIGTGGAWKPARKLWKEPLPGQLGYHTRTEYNKILLKIGTNPEEVNPKGGFLRYGLVKNSYVLLKGSVPGPAKRLIRLSIPRRPKESEKANFDILNVSLESKQGA